MDPVHQQKNVISPQRAQNSSKNQRQQHYGAGDNVEDEEVERMFQITSPQHKGPYPSSESLKHYHPNIKVTNSHPLDTQRHSKINTPEPSQRENVSDDYRYHTSRSSEENGGEEKEKENGDVGASGDVERDEVNDSFNGDSSEEEEVEENPHYLGINSRADGVIREKSRRGSKGFFQKDISEEMYRKTHRKRDMYDKMMDHDVFVSLFGFSKHVFKVKETTNLILFMGFGVLAVVLLDMVAHVSFRLAQKEAFSMTHSNVPFAGKGSPTNLIPGRDLSQIPTGYF